MRNARKFFFVIFVCVLASFISADVVKRKDGTRVKGRVISEDEDGVSVATDFGVVKIPKTDVAEIVKEPTLREQYETKLKETPAEDAKAQYELGLWCKNNGMKVEARYHFLKAIENDPDAAEARRELGYVFYGGRWVHETELKKILEGSDLVIHNGRVMTKEEYEKEQEGKVKEEPKPVEEPKPAEEPKPTVKDEGVEWSKAKTYSAPPFSIKSNCARSIASRYEDFLSSMVSTYRELFGQPRKDAKKFEVWLFRSADDYAQNTGRQQQPGIFYDTDACRVVTYDGAGADSGGTEPLLARYCAYQYVDQVMMDAQGAPPWIIEGLAGYCEAVEVSKMGKAKVGIIPRAAIMKVKAALSNGSLPTAIEMVKMPRSRFGENERAYAWSLAYFMLKSAQYSKALKSYFAYVSNLTFRQQAGQPPSRGSTPHHTKFQELVGDVDQLNTAWRTWISKTEVPTEGKISGDTFTSEKYEFSFRKPSSFSFLKESSDAGFIIGAEQGDAKIKVLVFANSQRVDAKGFVEKESRKLTGAYKNVETGEVSGANSTGAFILYTDSNQIRKPPGDASLLLHYDAVFTSETYIYVIRITCYEANRTKYEKEFSESVSSFSVGSK
ncbi:MAG: hypothetical protein N2234_00335 [Planctomycetota bacterium]|nr:hypothetical protein [Planctomycetota bacterium]